MTTQVETGRLLTVKETAEILGLHPMSTWRLINQRRIPSVQMGGPGSSLRVPEAELERWLNSRTRSER
jgi:excisionase family DNA binding protein